MPPAAPVTSATLPCSSPGGGACDELVELERPVLDREALGVVERRRTRRAPGRRPSPRSRGGRGRARAATPSSSAPTATSPTCWMSTTRASGSAGTVVASAWRVEVRAVLVAVRGGALADPLAQRRRRPRSSGRTGSTAAGAWCARGGPGTARRRSTSSGASREETNSSARGEVSTVSTFVRSLETAPRIAGSSSRRSAAALVVRDAAPARRRRSAARRRPCAR